MAQDTREKVITPDIIGVVNKCNKVTKFNNIKMSATLNRLRWCTSMYILLALFAAFITLTGAEIQSTFKHEVNDLGSSSSYVKDMEILPQSSASITISRADISNTQNSQVFSTVSAHAQNSMDSSVLSPWELPGGSRTEDVVDIAPSNALPATELSQLQPTSTQEETSQVKHTSAHTVSENEGAATQTNDVIEENLSKTLSHVERFQPTISESKIDSNSDVSSSESLRVARSIDHSATISSGSRQLVGRAIESGERLPTDEKTQSHSVAPRDKLVISSQGEGRRAPRVEHATAAVGPLGRQLPPHLAPNHNWSIHNATGRRSEPDIQDIIGGIVKLLGGNVNVAAVQGPPPLTGRPLRPMGTRINNRGPPRITDLAYESTSSTPTSLSTSPSPPASTRPPPPYPFDRPPPPPQNIPFPGMENSESFMSPPPMPQESSAATSRPSSTRPRPVWPRPQLPNRRPAYPDVPQQSDIQPEEGKPVETSSTTTSEEPPSSSSTSSTTTSTTTSTTSTTEAETTPLPPTTTTTTTTTEPPVVSPELNVIGVATPIQIESSLPDIITAASSSETPAPPPTSASRPAYARPGLVLDDPEFKPGGAANVPIITAPVRGHRPGALGEVFDVTVTAVQGPGNLNTGRPQVFQIPPEGSRPGVGGDVITSPEDGQHFVSIDGKRTYINLFPTEAGDQSSEASATPGGQTTTPQRPQTPTQKPESGPVIGAGFAVPDPAIAPRPGGAVPSKPPQQPPPRRRPPWTKRPPVRIDTCIVGDASTCDEAQNEACRTEQGVSSCHCRPGYSRRKHRDPCRRMVSVMLNMRVDRMYEKRTAWAASLTDPESEDYQQLEWESVRALDSAMGMTPFSDEFLGARVNGFLQPPAGKDGPATEGVVVNVTMQLVESAETVRPQVKQDIQRHLLGAITRRNNNIGESALWVDKPAGTISALQDLDECRSTELNDCNARAVCTNVFGTYRCACNTGLRDPWAGNLQRSGRTCEACPADYCSNRGECTFQPGGERLCTCTGNFYGSQCELDGEVLGVAIGATVAAVLIIGLTLLGLCMWSRRWNREQQKAEMLSTRTGITSPVFSYMAAAAAASSAASVKSGIPPGGVPAPFVSMEDRLRWAHIADVMAQNHYAPEPGMPPLPTRPSSAVFGAYPTSLHGTLTGTMPSLTMMHHQRPPPPTHGPPSSSDEEDNRDLLGRNFHVPRPRSRAASIANQSGIYYDLDYDTRPTPVPAPRNTLPRPPQMPPPIPMATYMQGGRFFR